ncbi:hypothetical protein VTP01DRAFT_9006 [Rhizomucor pusillus]|uniref:uncharacterized protein n=1 Tax=Rhizomucor pusillus TaxID=4840 RepID=UPI00374445F6
MASVYSTEDVKKHNKKKDLWIMIHNNVYDVTDFIQEARKFSEMKEVRKECRDATEVFEDIGHSTDARDIMRKYLIGSLDEASKVDNHRFHPIRAGDLPQQLKKS